MEMIRLQMLPISDSRRRTVRFWREEGERGPNATTVAEDITGASMQSAYRDLQVADDDGSVQA